MYIFIDMGAVNIQRALGVTGCITPLISSRRQRCQRGVINILLQIPNFSNYDRTDMS